MTPPDPYETHRAAFGAELRAAAPRLRRRRQRRVALAGTTVALAGAATVVAVVAPTTGSRLDVLTEAKAAITTTPGSIVHFALTTKSGFPLPDEQKRRAKGCKGGPTEVWQSTSGGELRYRTRMPLYTCSTPVVAGKIITGPFENSFGNGTTKVYSESDGYLRIATEQPTDRIAYPPVPFGDSRLSEGNPIDPVARIRSLLADRKLTDAGTIRGKNGRVVLRKLVGDYTELRGDPKAPKPWPVHVEYRVDAKTFAPVLLLTTQRMSVPVDPNDRKWWRNTVHRMVTEEAHFSKFEIIPLTPDSERLLDVQPKPGTETITEPTEQTDWGAKPSKAELARAKRITDAQIKAGIRKRADW